MDCNFIKFLVFFSFITLSHSLPLTTNSRWIIDEQTGQRVKLACGNWEGHTLPMLPEGLDQLPLADIARHIALMGFNCVRLTYATYMYTRNANLTVAQNFHDLELKEAMRGIYKNNPQLLHLTLIDAQKAVIDALGSHGVMVLLDNQVSKPIWCCNLDDGNGFWGDMYFDPKDWLNSLSMVATRYKNNPTVIAMSLRNELRGNHTNLNDWYHYVRLGAETIHKLNPNVLVLVSGLDYDVDFSHLRTKPLGLRLDSKLVYEAHSYPWTLGEYASWLNQSTNLVCDKLNQEFQNKSTFLVGDTKTPLFISEFGINQVDPNPSDNLWLSCYLNYLAVNDLDWSIWALHGNYYLRDGQQGTDELFGIFTANWTSLRNSGFHEKLLSIQRKIQEPISNNPYYLRMYHPMSGCCIRADDQNELHPTDCFNLSKWDHSGGNENPISLTGTELCLKAIGDGLPLIIENCNLNSSTWKFVSNYQISTGDNLCLHYDPNYSARILTKKCICTDEYDLHCLENPQSQWFNLIRSNAK